MQTRRRASEFWTNRSLPDACAEGMLLGCCELERTQVLIEALGEACLRVCVEGCIRLRLPGAVVAASFAFSCSIIFSHTLALPTRRHKLQSAIEKVCREQAPGSRWPLGFPRRRQVLGRMRGKVGHRATMLVSTPTSHIVDYHRQVPMSSANQFAVEGASAGLGG